MMFIIVQDVPQKYFPPTLSMTLPSERERRALCKSATHCVILDSFIKFIIEWFHCYQSLAGKSSRIF